MFRWIGGSSRMKSVFTRTQLVSVVLSVSHQRVLTLDDALEECEQGQLDYPTTQKERYEKIQLQTLEHLHTPTTP